MNFKGYKKRLLRFIEIEHELPLKRELLIQDLKNSEEYCMYEHLIEWKLPIHPEMEEKALLQKQKIDRQKAYITALENESEKLLSAEVNDEVPLIPSNFRHVVGSLAADEERLLDELDDILNFNQGTLNAVVSGNQPISKEHFFKLCNYFELDPTVRLWQKGYTVKNEKDISEDNIENAAIGDIYNADVFPTKSQLLNALANHQKDLHKNMLLRQSSEWDSFIEEVYVGLTERLLKDPRCTYYDFFIPQSFKREIDTIGTLRDFFNSKEYSFYYLNGKGVLFLSEPSWYKYFCMFINQKSELWEISFFTILLIALMRTVSDYYEGHMAHTDIVSSIISGMTSFFEIASVLLALIILINVCNYLYQIRRNNI